MRGSRSISRAGTGGGLRSDEVHEGQMIDETVTSPAQRFDREELPVAGDFLPVVGIDPIKFPKLVVYREHDAEHFAVIDGISVVLTIDGGDGARGQDGDAVAVCFDVAQLIRFKSPKIVDRGRPPQFIREGDLFVRRFAVDGGVVVVEDK